MARKKRRKRTKAVPAPAGSGADAAFRAGLADHQAGRLAGAAKHYRKALEIDENHADSWHLLGVAGMQSGDLTEAVTLFERAIGLKSDAPPFHDHLGLALRQMGRAAEAEAHHRRALDLDPDFAAGHNNLAGTLVVLNQIEEAETSARRALQLRPGDPDALANMGQILLAQGRAGAAVDAFEAAHKARPATPDSLAHLGAAYQRTGRRDEAEMVFKKALEAAPEAADIWNRYGVALLTMEKFGDSAAAFAAAAGLEPDIVGATVNSGIAHWRGGDLEAAEQAFDAALDRSPDDLGAILGMAAIYSASGDNEVARSLYYRALQTDPDNLDVFNNLATEGGGHISDAQAERLAGLLADRHLSDDDRAKAGFALAAYLRHCGHHDAAFDIFATANDFRAAALAASGTFFDRTVHDRHVKARVDLFTADFFAARRDMGSNDETPVFVVGMPRSGTTLVEQILASHAHVHGAGERRDMAEIGIERLPAMIGDDGIYPDCLKNVQRQQCHDVAGQYLDALRAAAPKARRIVDKMPFNFMHLGLIALLFPNTKIIHCRRDMRDVALSCFFTNFADSHPWSTGLGDIAHFIRAYRRLMAHWRKVLPLSILDIDYEALVENQEAESRRMIDHIGLKWDPACLNFHETARPVSTASRAQVRQPLYANAVGRWRTYEKWLGPLGADFEGPQDG